MQINNAPYIRELINAIEEGYGYLAFGGAAIPHFYRNIGKYTDRKTGEVSDAVNIKKSKGKHVEAIEDLSRDIAREVIASSHGVYGSCLSAEDHAMVFLHALRKKGMSDLVLEDVTESKLELFKIAAFCFSNAFDELERDATNELDKARGDIRLMFDMYRKMTRGN
ncbi:hypothetical protein [Paraburkholderia sp. EB58]|uniref:hypothetical protein n=1 Tax=Paraburkholderia sp. EB58 TaxID=3035125 RepID=UPI003D226EA9